MFDPFEWAFRPNHDKWRMQSRKLTLRAYCYSGEGQHSQRLLRKVLTVHKQKLE